MHLAKFIRHSVIDFKRLKKSLAIVGIAAGALTIAIVIGNASMKDANMFGTTEQVASSNDSLMISRVIGISYFSALRDGDAYQVHFALAGNDSSTKTVDFVGLLRFVDPDNNTLYSSQMMAKSSDFRDYNLTSGRTIKAYMIQVDESNVQLDQANSPVVANAQAYLARAVSQHGSGSAEAEQAGQMVDQSKQLAAESLTAIIDIQLPDGRSLTASTPVIG